MKKYFGRAIHLMVISAILLSTWSVFQFGFQFVHIVDMLKAYSVLWCVVSAAVVFGLYIFAYTTAISSCFALIAEYMISTMNVHRLGHSTGSGMVANLAILVIGVMIGLILQIISKWHKSHK